MATTGLEKFKLKDPRFFGTEEERAAYLKEEIELAPHVTGLLELSRPPEVSAEKREEVLKKLIAAFESGESDTIYSLDGNDALAGVEILYEALRANRGSSDPLIQSAVYLIQRRFCKLARMSKQVPQCFRATGVVVTPNMKMDPEVDGGFANILHSVRNGEPVVLKQLRALTTHSTEKEDAIESLIREATVWRCLPDSPYILPFYGIYWGDIPIAVAGSDFGPLMVSPFMGRGNLRDTVNILHSQRKKPIQELASDINRWLYHVSLGLAVLHSSGIAHGDVRGVNVLIAQNGTACLADFGISVIDNVGSSNTRNQEHGIVAWKAPELLEDLNDLDSPFNVRPTTSSDIYSFGCLCIELYSGGEGPFHNKKSSVIHIQVKLHGVKPGRPRQIPMDDGLWEIIEACIGDVATRPSAESLAESMSKFVK